MGGIEPMQISIKMPRLTLRPMLKPSCYFYIFLIYYHHLIYFKANLHFQNFLASLTIKIAAFFFMSCFDLIKTKLSIVEAFI